MPIADRPTTDHVTALHSALLTPDPPHPTVLPFPIRAPGPPGVTALAMLRHRWSLAAALLLALASPVTAQDRIRLDPAELPPPLDSVDHDIVVGAIARATALQVVIPERLENTPTADGRSVGMLRDACNVPGGAGRPPIGDDCLRLALALIHLEGFEREPLVLLRGCILGNLLACELAILGYENPELATPALSSAFTQDCEAAPSPACGHADVEAVARLSAGPLRRRQVADVLLEYAFQESPRWTATTMAGALAVLARQGGGGPSARAAGDPFSKAAPAGARRRRP